jgi:hypothetical protein
MEILLAENVLVSTALRLTLNTRSINSPIRCQDADIGGWPSVGGIVGGSSAIAVERSHLSASPAMDTWRCGADEPFAEGRLSRFSLLRRLGDSVIDTGGWCKAFLDEFSTRNGASRRS